MFDIRHFVPIEKILLENLLKCVNVIPKLPILHTCFTHAMEKDNTVMDFFSDAHAQIDETQTQLSWTYAYKIGFGYNIAK